MKIGLCLTGGGAKGAFEGGVIKRLGEIGITPEIVTGTSIGAINAYFMMTNSFSRLESLWNEMDGSKYEVKIDKTIDNSGLINELYGLSGENEGIRNVFVNYVHVKERRLSEVVVDLKGLVKEEAIKAVKYSSLLPAPSKDDSRDGFDSKMLFECFGEAVQNGEYEDYKLDGGILDNSLLSPFTSGKVDKILIVGLKDSYLPPDYIYDFYDKKSILVVKPDIPVLPEDTMKFEREYCADMFKRGYRHSKEIVSLLY